MFIPTKFTRREQSRSQNLRYPYPAERATDALEESKILVPV